MKPVSDGMLAHQAMRRFSASLVLACALAHGAAALAQAGEGFYRYSNAKGRVVYTNIVDQVPLDQRAHARVDLSHVSLNTEVGSEIDRRLEEEHASLIKSPYCARLRAAAEEGFLDRLWEDFAPLIACGGLLLALLLVTPAALRRFGAPEWAKVLCMAIPSLAVAGLVMFSMSYTNKTLTALKQRAKPCVSETFAKLSGQKDALLQHVQLVGQLKQEMAKLTGGEGDKRTGGEEDPPASLH